MTKQPRQDYGYSGHTSGLVPNPPQQGESGPISELDDILDFPQGTSIETIKAKISALMKTREDAKLQQVIDLIDKLAVGPKPRVIGAELLKYGIRELNSNTTKGTHEI